ncbi:hypothetical protein DVA76_20150, partial [Acinetobacter baumannii]
HTNPLLPLQTAGGRRGVALKAIGYSWRRGGGLSQSAGSRVIACESRPTTGTWTLGFACCKLLHTSKLLKKQNFS